MARADPEGPPPTMATRRAVHPSSARLTVRSVSMSGLWALDGDGGLVVSRWPPDDLASRRPGNGLHRRELEGYLVRGKEPGTMCLQAFQVAAARVPGDLRAGHFAQARVGPAE